MKQDQLKVWDVTSSLDSPHPHLDRVGDIVIGMGPVIASRSRESSNREPTPNSTVTVECEFQSITIPKRHRNNTETMSKRYRKDVETVRKRHRKGKSRSFRYDFDIVSTRCKIAGRPSFPAISCREALWQHHTQCRSISMRTNYESSGVSMPSFSTWFIASAYSFLYGHE